MIKPLVDIADYYMERPTNEFLLANGQNLSYENPKSKINIYKFKLFSNFVFILSAILYFYYLKINISVSKVFVIGNRIFIGYEDGLILIWLQQVYSKNRA